MNLKSQIATQLTILEMTLTITEEEWKQMIQNIIVHSEISFSDKSDGVTKKIIIRKTNVTT